MLPAPLKALDFSPSPEGASPRSRASDFSRPFACHVGQTEGRVQLANDVERRQRTTFELVDVRSHLFVDKAPQGVAEHQVGVGHHSYMCLNSSR